MKVLSSAFFFLEVLDCEYFIQDLERIFDDKDILKLWLILLHAYQLCKKRAYDAAAAYLPSASVKCTPFFVISNFTHLSLWQI